MKKLLHLPLLLSLTISTFACQSDHKDAQEQFRERQEAILERNDAQPEIITDTIVDEIDLIEQNGPLPEKTDIQKSPTVAGDKVVGVKDGDTIVLLKNGEEVTVRLYGVDTPEKSQAFGQKAKQFTSDMVFGKQVQLIVKNKDRYGRTVGTIILQDGRNLNEELIKNGFAWHYKAYSKDLNLANAEADARRFKRGLWQDPNPVAPWDYRKDKRSKNTSSKTTSAKTVLPVGAAKRTVYLCNSSGSAVYHSDKSCSVLKRCKSDVLIVTEASAISEYGRRADKTCN